MSKLKISKKDRPKIFIGLIALVLLGLWFKVIPLTTTTQADIYDADYQGTEYNFICSEVCFSKSVGNSACFTTTCGDCPENSSCYDGNYCVTCDDSFVSGMLNGIPMTSYSQVNDLHITLSKDFLVRVTSKESGFHARSYFVGGVGDYPLHNGVYEELGSECVDSDGANFETSGFVTYNGMTYNDDICKSTLSGGYYNSYTLTDYICKSMTTELGTYKYAEKKTRKCCADCLPATECSMSLTETNPCDIYNPVTTTTTTPTGWTTTPTTYVTTTTLCPVATQLCPDGKTLCPVKLENGCYVPDCTKCSTPDNSWMIIGGLVAIIGAGIYFLKFR